MLNITLDEWRDLIAIKSAIDHKVALAQTSGVTKPATTAKLVSQQSTLAKVIANVNIKVD